MFKILTIIGLLFVAYRLFFAEPKQLQKGQKTSQEPDEFVDYEEVEDEK